MLTEFALDSDLSPTLQKDIDIRGARRDFAQVPNGVFEFCFGRAGERIIVGVGSDSMKERKPVESAKIAEYALSKGLRAFHAPEPTMPLFTGKRAENTASLCWCQTRRDENIVCCGVLDKNRRPIAFSGRLVKKFVLIRKSVIPERPEP